MFGNTRRKLKERILQSTLVRTSHRFSFRKVIEAKIVNRWLHPQKGDAVLDVASGLGYHCYELSGRGCHVYGLDLETENTILARMISAKLAHKPQYITGNAEALPFKSRTFEKVICVCALEHFIDDGQALHEISRVLKPNGVLILTVESWTGKVDARLKTVAADRYEVRHFYSLPKLTELLDSAGFKVKEGSYFLNSPISRFLYELEHRLYYYSLLRRLKLGLIIGSIFYPLTYILCTVSDHLWGNLEAGYELGVCAIKVPKRDQ